MAVEAIFNNIEDAQFKFVMYTDEQGEKEEIGHIMVSPTMWTLYIHLNGLVPFLSKEEEEKIRDDVHKSLEKYWLNFKSFHISYV